MVFHLSSFFEGVFVVYIGGGFSVFCLRLSVLGDSPIPGLGGGTAVFLSF